MIGVPKQKRSIATKNKIKKVARKLFADRGYYDVTSNMIAAKAKVPIGSFYNYYGNKKELILELIRDFNQKLHASTIQKSDTLLNDVDSPKKVFDLMKKGIRDVMLSPNLADPFYSVIHALQFTEPDVLALSEEYRQIELTTLIKFLDKINELHAISNIPLTAKLILTTGENMALYIHHLGTIFDKEELVEETTKMFSEYIFRK